ncbi:uncharacterized protein SCHCODRAFT_02369451 [Schizophyllum commune H4-8]|uniref:uncharacterized protein n=1 Tax=Schizophyllum commune (strain H4-8 / FGSC 9210) TaxID=578458 RepID=UPI00215E79D2|nr:uncharacterized protein SCHCODRAFT_02369451 [Schizophyllum commune H4-8]KAI5889510.1 hypothetical protein SCHCODRAFT_02369451 [Schizophyllum commune H4-8]
MQASRTLILPWVDTKRSEKSAANSFSRPVPFPSLFVLAAMVYRTTSDRHEKGSSLSAVTMHPEPPDSPEPTCAHVSKPGSTRAAANHKLCLHRHTHRPRLVGRQRSSTTCYRRMRCCGHFSCT